MEMWLALFLLLLPPASCTISLEGLQGQFASLEYPQGYPNDASQSWEIEVPRGYGIKFSFTHIDIEPSPDCAYDNVQIFSDEALYPPICGTWSRGGKRFQFPQEYYTSGNWMRVTFKSDFSNEERYAGFSAYYTAVDINECEESDPCSHFCNNFIGGFYCSCRPGYFLQENRRICGVQCSGEVFTQFKGIITSPNYPEAYAENSNCHYRIQIEQGFELILKFADEFDVEGDPSNGCTSDVLKVTTGVKEYGPFCGSQAPVVSGLMPNVVEITFSSNDQGERKGWKIMYSSTAKQCPVDILKHNIVQPKKLEYDYKDAVRVRCEPGFELFDEQRNHHVGSATVHCQKDGTWNSSLYSCRPVDCGPPVTLSNGNANFTSTVYKFRNMYSCEEPYYKLEGNALFECSAKADWVTTESGDNTLPKCKPVCGKSAISADTGRIFGGKRAKPGYFPWQVRLVTSDGHMGGGALISDGWVLTAAHLFDGSLQTEVRGGIVDLRNARPENRYPAKQAIVHPDYRKEASGREPNFDHDVALVKLQKKVKLGPSVSPVCLPSAGGVHPPELGKLGYIAGWGKTEERNLAINLQYAEVPVVSMNKCEQASYKGKKPIFTSNMICAGAQGTDSCQGDSGGPYVFSDPLDPSRHLVRGIVSFGPQQCGSYGVYTHVGQYLDWIEKTMEEHESDEVVT
uniref:Complement protein 1S n=1 Tax=Squalus acanthias TaxID=7797 RepID=H9LDW9_SQUAC|nr:complement protein 1S [Squalus acanthias]